MKKYNQGKTLYCGGYAGAIALEYKTGKKYDPIKFFKETDKLFENSNGGGLYITSVMKYLEYKGYITNYSRISPKKKWIEKYLKTGIVLVKLNKFRYRWNTFYRDNRSMKAHIMAVIDIDDTYVYTWNSWGDGKCKFKLKDFDNTAIFVKGDIKEKIKNNAELQGKLIKKMTYEEVLSEFKKVFKIYELVSPAIYKKWKNKQNILWRSVDEDLMRFHLWVRLGYGKPMYCNNWYWGGNRKNSGYDDGSYRGKTSMSGHRLFKAMDTIIKDTKASVVRKWIKDNMKYCPVEYVRLERKKDGKEITWLHADVIKTKKGLSMFNV